MTEGEYDDKNKNKLQAYKALSKHVLTENAQMIVVKNDYRAHNFNIGSIRFKTQSKQANDGPAFGLLLSYVYARLLQLKNAKQNKTG